MIQMDTFLHFYLRDIDKFIAETEAFPTEESLWVTGGDVKNPAGTLGLHIAGNLQHFIGSVLGGTGYVRQRELEFSLRGVPKSDILDGLHTARKVVETVFSNMSDAHLNAVFPADHFGENRSTLHALLHLQAHLSYHLGQLNYLRRLVAMPG